MMPPGSEYNTDTLGVKFSKKRHDLYAVDITMFDAPVQWFSRQLIQLGYEPRSALLIPERESWFFYDKHGEHIWSVEHELMEHIWDMLNGHIDGA